jgi:hypothetical protein
MKKLFLVLLVLLAGVTGLSAMPLRPDRGDDTLQMVMLLEDVELICLGPEQYRQGLLTQDEFKTLVAGQIVILVHDYLTISCSRLKAGAGSMKFLAENTRKKVDRLFMYRELELGIQHHGGLSE